MTTERAQFYKPINLKTPELEPKTDNPMEERLIFLIENTFRVQNEKEDGVITDKQEMLHNILNKLEKNKNGELEIPLKKRQIERRVREAQCLGASIAHDLMGISSTVAVNYRRLSIDKDQQKEEKVRKKAKETEVLAFQNVFADIQDVTGVAFNLWNISENAIDIIYSYGREVTGRWSTPSPFEVSQKSQAAS